MKEFIEKLIGRLEECEKAPKVENPYNNGWKTACHVMKNAVNQLTEEYKHCIKSSCSNCEVYDAEKHYCPKWCDVIKHTTEELAEEYNNESVKGDLISRNNLLQKFCINSDGRRIPEVDCDNHEITVSIKDIKRIIREQPTAYNDEWTLCNNGLPRSGVSVIVSYKDRFLAQADGTCEGWYDATNMIWHLTDYEYSNNVEVIAWRERLAPYQPKGE